MERGVFSGSVLQLLLRRSTVFSSRLKMSRLLKLVLTLCRFAVARFKLFSITGPTSHMLLSSSAFLNNRNEIYKKNRFNCTKHTDLVLLCDCEKHRIEEAKHKMTKSYQQTQAYWYKDIKSSHNHQCICIFSLYSPVLECLMVQILFFWKLVD